MGYQVKWVEKHLGVTRKALRLYEEKGLLPKNEGGQYRNYDDEDLERIWAIKILQGMGYTLSEISKFAEWDEEVDFDFHKSITQKVNELEDKKAEIERHLGYARMIQFSGRFPSRPKEMGSITFDMFQKKALDAWNVQTDSRIESVASLMNLMELPEENWSESEMAQLLKTLVDLGMNQATMEASMGLHALIKAILARSDQGADSSEVQLLVKILYEQIPEFDPKADMSPNQFGRLYSSSFMEGQVGLINQQKYGAEGCAFLADAIAIFGGYKNYLDTM